MFFRNQRRMSVPSTIKPLKTEKAHLVLISAKPAEAALAWPRNCSVDECAYNLNHGRLCDQFNKKVPNNAAINQLVRETHQQRRKRIGDSSTYPFFTRVLLEFTLMCGEEAISRIGDSWTKLY